MQGLLRDFATHSRVQRGIVVHFQLAIEPEAARAREDIAPERIKACSQVGPVLGRNGHPPLAIRFHAASRSILSASLFAGGGDLQKREDEGRAMINPGGSEFSGAAGIGRHRAAGFLKQTLIRLFQGVVAAGAETRVRDAWR